MAYFDDVYEFVKGEAGEENLIHFTVHMDETTPHAHFGFTPIKDGALSWKKFFDGKYALQELFRTGIGSRSAGSGAWSAGRNPRTPGAPTRPRSR